MNALEEKVALLIRQVEEMSDVVARQDRESQRLKAQVERLILREAEREAEGVGGVVLGDERPPHY